MGTASQAVTGPRLQSADQGRVKRDVKVDRTNGVICARPTSRSENASDDRAPQGSLYDDAASAASRRAVRQRATAATLAARLSESTRPYTLPFSLAATARSNHGSAAASWPWRTWQLPTACRLTPRLSESTRPCTLPFSLAATARSNHGS